MRRPAVRTFDLPENSCPLNPMQRNAISQSKKSSGPTPVANLPRQSIPCNTVHHVRPIPADPAPPSCPFTTPLFSWRYRCLLCALPCIDTATNATRCNTKSSFRTRNHVGHKLRNEPTRGQPPAHLIYPRVSAHSTRCNVMQHRNRINHPGRQRLQNLPQDRIPCNTVQHVRPVPAHPAPCPTPFQPLCFLGDPDATLAHGAQQHCRSNATRCNTKSSFRIRSHDVRESDSRKRHKLRNEPTSPVFQSNPMQRNAKSQSKIIGPYRSRTALRMPVHANLRKLNFLSPNARTAVPDDSGTFV